MANVRQRIEWIDEPIIIETDTDGNYPPIAEATINSSNDVMIVVKDMEADTFCHAKVVVRASPDVVQLLSIKLFMLLSVNPESKPNEWIPISPIYASPNPSGIIRNVKRVCSLTDTRCTTSLAF